MPSTTHPEFGHDTEGLEVAKAFADQIRGKTILVTGANSSGIAYTTLEAFVSINPSLHTPIPKTEVPTLTGLSIPLAPHPRQPHPLQNPPHHRQAQILLPQRILPRPNARP